MSQMPAVQRVERDRLCATFDGRLEPVARIRSGEQIVFETEDARGGQTRTPERTTPAYLREMQARGWVGNPVTGPVFVESAAIGDTLVIHVEDVACDTIGFTTNWPHLMHMADWFPDPETVLMQITDGAIEFDESIRVPVRPMIGTIGTAPAVQALSTGTSGRHGGNLDVPEIGPGAPALPPGGGTRGTARCGRLPRPPERR